MLLQYHNNKRARVYVLLYATVAYLCQHFSKLQRKKRKKIERLVEESLKPANGTVPEH